MTYFAIYLVNSEIVDATSKEDKIFGLESLLCTAECFSRKSAIHANVAFSMQFYFP